MCACNAVAAIMLALCLACAFLCTRLLYIQYTLQAWTMDVASASVSTGLPEAVVVLLREGDADMREKVRWCMMVRMCRVHVAIPYTSFCRCMESQ